MNREQTNYVVLRAKVKRLERRITELEKRLDKLIKKDSK